MKKGYRKVRVIAEGPEKKGAERAMGRAGFDWIYKNVLHTRDREGKLLKIPLR